MNSLRNSNIIRRGKRLAFLLRHDRNYPFDEHGWREISDLITHHGYTEEKLPPDILYHGTGEQSLAPIMEQGINKGNRLYVHLSKTSETAVNVGKRHGKPVVLIIDAKQMAEDGHKFYLSRNGVWLTDYVDVKYLKEDSK